MNVVLLGAGGFCGGHIARSLTQSGHHVVCALRPARVADGIPAFLSGLDVRAVDLTTTSVERFLRAAEPEAVVDAAWSEVGASGRDGLAQQENVARIARVLDSLDFRRTRVWVGLGSQAEYGRYECRVDERFPAQPVTAYGRAKLAALRLLSDRLGANGARLAWIRLFGLYGPRQPSGWLVPDAIAALQQDTELALSPGDQRCDYLYIEDAADACALALERREASGILNVGSGRAVAVRELVVQLKDILGSRAELHFGAHPYRPGQAMFSEADITRIRLVTGWRPTTSLAEGLRRTVRSYIGA